MGLDNLSGAGGRKRKKRVGRGPASGTGGTAGRGHKGQLSRSGAKVRPWFEGGQMPLQRRLPKRGFTNIWRRPYSVVHAGDLERFEANAVVDPVALVEAGLLKRVSDRVKVLADGELDKPLVVRAQAFSAAARAKIEKAGGQAEVIEPVRIRSKALAAGEEG